MSDWPVDTWADEILSKGPEACAPMYGPFHVHPTHGFLFMTEELVARRADSADHRTPPSDPIRLPPGPEGLAQLKHGWTSIQLDDRGDAKIWCPPGADDFVLRGGPPSAVRGERAGELTLPEMWTLFLNGHAFLFEDEFFLLSERDFVRNNYTYELPNNQKLHVVVGFRGQNRSYATALTPSVFRANGDDAAAFVAYKKREIYATNLLRQAFYELRNRVLTDIEARGILQHHKTIGDTNILDLSWDVDIAKWFALNEFTTSGWRAKTFDTKAAGWDAVSESACVYKIVVRIIGGTTEPLETQFRGRDVTLLPENIYPLDQASERAERQRGFGLTGLLWDDLDPQGAILNVNEWRFHPVAFPDGWDTIGGPKLSIGGRDWSILEDLAQLAPQILPPEPDWFREILQIVRRKVSSTFGRVEGSPLV